VNPRVLRRFIFLMALLTVGAFVFWDVLDDFVRREPGDYYTEVGSNRLVDELYDEALDNFDKALEGSPDHRGALMGRGLVFIRTERYEDAVAEFDYLIGYLDRTLEPDDRTGVGALAAAYANRGVAYDFLGEYQKALDSYVEALKVDEEVVEGPGVVHKILYGSDRVSTVRDRARYIYEQLQKPEDERLMRIPELDAKQRMHKP
jgi:tetratricopeptide (TPR) repeat protein